MINIDFDVSKINILIHIIMMYQKIQERPEEKWDYSLFPAKNNDFIQMLGNQERLKQILTSEQLELCRNVLTNKDFDNKTSKETFFSAICNGYEMVNDSNYQSVFKKCLKEYGNSEFRSELYEKLLVLYQAMEKLIDTDEFNRLYHDTCEYKDELNELWGKNKEYISSFVESITRVKINTTSKVMVLPPIFDEGFTSSGPNREISFSRCHDNRSNNDLMELVYLTHEAMHSQVLTYETLEEQDRKIREKYPNITDENFKKARKEHRQNLHGFIQYLCDNELYSRLAEERGISYTYGENKQHGIEDETFYNMYPFFIGYLYRNEENSVECIKRNMWKNKSFLRKSERKEAYSPLAIANYFRGRSEMSPYWFSSIDFNKEIEKMIAKDRKNELNNNHLEESYGE